MNMLQKLMPGAFTFVFCRFMSIVQCLCLVVLDIQIQITNHAFVFKASTTVLKILKTGEE